MKTAANPLPAIVSTSTALKVREKQAAKKAAGRRGINVILLTTIWRSAMYA